MSKKYEAEVKALAGAYGFVHLRSKNHDFWRHPNGATVTTSKSPSDRHVMKKIEADFRRGAGQREAA